MRTIIIFLLACMAGLAVAAPAVDLPMIENEDAVELPLPPAPSAVPAIPAVQFNLPRAAEKTAEPKQVALASDPQIAQMLAAVKSEGSPRAAIESMLYDQLRASLPEGTEGVVLDKASLPSDLKLPASGWDAKFDFHMPARGTGTVPYIATVTAADGKVLRKFSGGVRLDREARGVQTTRVIRRGEAIQAGDVKVMNARLSELDRGALDNADMLAGTVARQELRPGRWITEQMIEAPKVIKRGQPVTMRVARGTISITTSGIAGQSGSVGQIIPVKNAQSQVERFARVISSDEVQVVY